MKTWIDIRILGNVPEIKEFITLCKNIEMAGVIGTNQKFTLRVDGDGSGKLGFKFINAFEEEEFPTGTDEEYKQLRNSDNIDLYIGE